MGVWGVKAVSSALVLAFASLIAPFTSILVAVLLSSSWSFIDDALSDLGDPSRGLIAVVFNGGLIVGGLLTSVYSLLYLLRVDRRGSLILLLAALFLMLVGGFNVSFGVIHIAVSAGLFLSLTAVVLYCVRVSRSDTPLIGLILAVLLWVSHIVLHVPRGAALPEILSVAIACLCYLRYLVLPYSALRIVRSDVK